MNCKPTALNTHKFMFWLNISKYLSCVYDWMVQSAKCCFKSIENYDNKV